MTQHTPECNCGTTKSHNGACPIQTLMEATLDLVVALRRFAIVAGPAPQADALYQMTGEDILAARAAIAKAMGEEG